MKQVPLAICLLLSLFTNAQKGKSYLLTHKEQFNKNLKDWLGCFKNLSLNDFKYQASGIVNDTGKKTYAKLKSYLDLLHKKANVVF